MPTISFSQVRYLSKEGKSNKEVKVFAAHWNTLVYFAINHYLENDIGYFELVDGKIIHYE